MYRRLTTWREIISAASALRCRQGVAAPVAVMIIVAVSTFDWHSVAPATLKRMPYGETIVMVATTLAAPRIGGLEMGRHDRGPRAHRYGPRMTVVRSVLLFVVAALFEIGGAWLIWQGWREHRGLWWIAAGVIALGAYGFVATFQPDPNFGRILAAYGGVFVAGSLAWGVIVDKFRPDRWDLIGAGICLIGVALIMYAPRSAGGS